MPKMTAPSKTGKQSQNRHVEFDFFYQTEYDFCKKYVRLATDVKYRIGIGSFIF